MTLEIIRIILRYLGMFLVSRGMFAPGTADSIFADPQLVQIVAGVASALVAEVGYGVSKWRAAK